ncbi:MAG: NADH-quinone oxidoreductase subunit E, partial [Bacteroidetes bacterium QH_2_64_74]
MAAPSMFFFLATVAVAAALGMLIARNPVASALWLVLNLFCIAGLYLTLNASFIGAIQILIYAGAIMVLFLFVIMLLNLSALPELEKLDWPRIG